MPEFDAGFVQLLAPDGERVDHPDYHYDGDAEQVRGLYRDMVLARRFDTEATALQRHGELGLWAPLLGQEAAQIGAGRAVAPQDMVFPTYREHGIAWTRGLDPIDVLRLFRGVDQGTWDPAEHGFERYTVVIGSQTLHAVGYALGLQLDGAVGTGDAGDAAVLACFGDGATSQGDVNEAFVFAAAYHLPVVFLCQNNQYAISEPVERQTTVPIAQRAAGFGFPGVRVDGNDVLAVYAVVREALRSAREGGGPVLVEAVTYRMGAHTTTDDPTRYRTRDEEAEWRAKDPIDRVAALLRREGAASESFFARIDHEADELGERLRDGVRALPEPDSVALFGQVYAEVPDELVEQQSAHAAWLASFAEPVEATNSTVEVA